MFSKISAFLAELKRRKVYNVAAAYVVTAWVMALGAAELFPYFGIPDWAVRLVVATAILGFPVAIVLAWAFEVTPDGVVRDADVRTARPRYSASASTTRPQSDVPIFVTFEGDQRLEFTTDFTIGRDEKSDVCITNDRVSRQHARVYLDQRLWRLRDLESRNGTYVDDDPVEDIAIEGTMTVSLAKGGPTVSLEVGSGAATVTVAG